MSKGDVAILFGLVVVILGLLVGIACADPEIAIPAIDADAMRLMEARRAMRPPRRRVMSVTTNGCWRIVHFDDLTSRSNRVVEVRLEPPPKVKYGYPQRRD